MLYLEVDHPYAAADSTETPGTYGDQQGRVYGVDGAMALNHHTVGAVMQKTFSTGENLLMDQAVRRSVRGFSNKNSGCYVAMGEVRIDCRS